MALTICEAISQPHVLYEGGLIAIRAYDFVGASRGTLSVVANGESRVGTVVRESQFSDGVNDDEIYANADPTLSIPLSVIPIEEHLQYYVYVRYRAAGGSLTLGQGVRHFGRGSFIGADLNDNVDTSLRGSGGCGAYPFFKPYAANAALGWYQDGLGHSLPGFPETTDTLTVKALSWGSVVWDIDQVFLIPRAHGFGNDTSYLYAFQSSWWSNFPDEDTYMIDQDPWGRGTQWSTDDSEPWGGTGLSGAGRDYQQQASYADAEYSDVDIGNNGSWDERSYKWIVGVGPVWVPQSEVFYEEFNRDIADAWGKTVTDYNWWVKVDDAVYTDVVQNRVNDEAFGPGNTWDSGRVSSYFSNFEFATIDNLLSQVGSQTGQTSAPRFGDWNGNFNLQAMVSCIAPSVPSYMICLGYGGLGGPMASDIYFAGIAIFCEFVGTEPVETQTHMYPNLVIYRKEATPRWEVLMGDTVRDGSWDLGSDVHRMLEIEVNREGEYIWGRVEGKQLNGIIPAYRYSGEWVPLAAAQPGESFNMDPRRLDFIMFGNGNDSTLTIDAAFIAQLRVTLQSQGEAPTVGYFGQEPIDGHIEPEQIALPWGTMHVVACSPDQYGNEDDTTILNWNHKVWLADGGDTSAMAMCDYHFRMIPEVEPPEPGEELGPVHVAHRFS